MDHRRSRASRPTLLPPSFVSATASGKPAIIGLRIEPEAITPNTTLAEIRDKALKSRAR